MMNRIGLYILIIFLPILGGCGDENEELEKQHTAVIHAAVILIEKHRVISIKDPLVIDFKKQHPNVVELIIIMDKKNRAMIIQSGAYKERVNERTYPVTGLLYFKNREPIKFVEFRKECKYGESNVTILLRIGKI